ncbi:MAG TPA: hypothetical protein VNQ79_06685 [Blastocatellia bacterium]|nr:hypothetical protein [Blastocatellia bacterium]
MRKILFACLLVCVCSVSVMAQEQSRYLTRVQVVGFNWKGLEGGPHYIFNNETNMDLVAGVLTADRELVFDRAGNAAPLRLTGFILPLFEYQDEVVFYVRIRGQLFGSAFELRLSRLPDGKKEMVAVQPYGETTVTRNGRQYRLKLTGSPVKDRLFDLTVELQDDTAGSRGVQRRTLNRVLR